MLQSANGMDQVTGSFLCSLPWSQEPAPTFWAEQDYSVFAKRIKSL